MPVPWLSRTCSTISVKSIHRLLVSLAPVSVIRSNAHRTRSARDSGHACHYPEKRGGNCLPCLIASYAHAFSMYHKQATSVKHPNYYFPKRAALYTLDNKSAGVPLGKSSSQFYAYAWVCTGNIGGNWNVGNVSSATSPAWPCPHYSATTSPAWPCPHSSSAARWS